MQTIKNDRMYTIPFLPILYICVVYTIVFEWYLPQFHERYTSDLFDAVAYFSGGVLFYSLQKLS